MCPHMSEEARELFGVSYKGTNAIHDLIISQRPYLLTLAHGVGGGVRISMYEFREWET